MAKGYSPNYNVDVRAADCHHSNDITNILSVKPQCLNLPK